MEISSVDIDLISFLNNIVSQYQRQHLETFQVAMPLYYIILIADMGKGEMVRLVINIPRISRPLAHTRASQRPIWNSLAYVPSPK